MAEFASKGVAGAGLGTGIAGLALGVLNSSNINSAFDKSGAVEYLGFKFDKSDGEALINIMEKYNDNAE